MAMLDYSEITKGKYIVMDGQPYEVLVGVAAMLTRECRVWWSKRFDVQEPRP